MNTKLVITASLIMLLFAVAGFAQDVGGPDTFGYIWKNSNADGGPVYTWIEPDTTHDAVAEYTEFDDDGNTPMLPLNFSFPYYDNVYTEVCIGTNGIIGFSTDNMTHRFAQDFPDVTAPDNIIAWFYDDLNPIYTWTSSHCYYENIVYNDHDAFLISFIDYAEYLSSETGEYPDDCIQAQVILVETGDIIIQYDWFGSDFDLTTCSIGIENADATDGLCYDFENPEGANVTDDMALAFYRPIPADNDLRATAIDGALVTDVGVETAYTVTVYNNGTVAQNTYDVKLMANEGTELATTAGTAIEPGEAIDFTLNWTPDSGGFYNIYGQTALTGDENTDNDHCQPIEVYVNPEHDMAALGVTGNSIPTAGVATTYTVSVVNLGSATGESYTLSLKDTNDNVLAEQNETSGTINDTVDVTIDWTPTEVGPAIIFAEVTLTDDEVSDNNTSTELSVSVMPASVETVDIGDGTDTSYNMPITFFYRNSLSQTIYFPEELDLEVGCDLTAIKYYNSFPDDIELLNMPINIWIGETQLDDLSGGYVSPGDLTQVFSGTVSFPSGENEIIIPLNEWYTYDGENLLVYVQRPWDDDWYNSNCKFKYTVTEDHADRTRSSWDDTTHFDAMNPPTDDFTLYNQIPNTTLYFANAASTGITGYVYDDQTSPIADATVTMTPGNVQFTTGVDGYYHFLDIDPGTYSLTAEAQGYESDTIDDIVVEEDETENVNFNLEQIMTVTIQVSTNAGSPEGAALVFENGTDTYEETVPENGTVHFYEIPNGTYSLEITLDGFADYSEDDITIDGSTELTAELTEITTPPTNPECNFEGYFTWSAPEAPVALTRNVEARKQVNDNLTRNNKSYREEPLDRPLQHYIVYLDGQQVNTTDNLNYQFDTTGLTVGQTYTAGVAAQYVSGVSTTVTVDFTYGQEELYAPVNVTCDSLGVLRWESGEPQDMLRKNGSRKEMSRMDRDFIQYRVYLDDEYVNFTLNTQYQYTGLEENTTYTAGVSAFYTSGNSTIVEVEFTYMPESTNEADVAPVTTSILGNYPNPFNPETTIRFAISQPGQTSLTIYNVKGQKVRTLVDQHLDAKVHNIVWNGRDNSGKNVTSGVYYAVLKSVGATPGVKKMILLK